jgi:cyclopropane fatty-acyl-phospholipid synthase-like methyltransferase
MELPEHLGGHVNQTHLDKGVLNYMKEKYNVKTLLDVGCGPGGMVQLARTLNIDAHGIDGDFTILPKENHFYVHDYQEGPSTIDLQFDMVWSCEFVEHVYEEYLPHYVQDFMRGKFLVMTYSDHHTGYHHVNVKPQSYWIKKIESYGFEFDEEETQTIRTVSTMNRHKPAGKQFVANTGLFFKNVTKY